MANCRSFLDQGKLNLGKGSRRDGETEEGRNFYSGLFQKTSKSHAQLADGFIDRDRHNVR